MRATLLLVAAAFALGTDAADDDRSKLQGTWQAISAEQGGENDPNAAQYTMTFDKDTVLIRGEKDRRLKGTFKLDPTKSPKHMDLAIEEGPEAYRGKTGLAIYEIEGDTLRWAVAPTGAAIRPSGFGSTTKTTNMVVVLKRSKK